MSNLFIIISSLLIASTANDPVFIEPGQETARIPWDGYYSASE